MSTGWIKLHREIKDHWIWEKDEYFKAFVTIIIECNHTDQTVLIDGELLDCKRGQKIYSLSTWAKTFGKHWSIQRVRTFFALLSRDAIIEVEGLRKTTRLSLVNYETYQGEQQTANTQPTRSQQQLKNVKNEKNKYTVEQIIDFLNSTCRTSYKSSTKKTIDIIALRLKEGFTFDDFKTVIAKKHSAWDKTEFAKYLRPETLFGNKFEGYLNELKEKTQDSTMKVF